MKVRRVAIGRTAYRLIVSIHAPVKVRRGRHDTGAAKTVSIHAPVKVRRNFYAGPPLTQVSIHAPVKVRRDVIPAT